jgi:hypothetical protein
MECFCAENAQKLSYEHLKFRKISGGGGDTPDPVKGGRGRGGRGEWKGGRTSILSNFLRP